MPYRVFGDLTAVCPECGAYISKVKRHRKWHKKNKMAKVPKHTADEAMLGP